ncbi:lysosomal acid phosphatase-like [Hydractinia symbiolongicarpus]|uniref:lysosomal acid phosphatase-like n=1 Tax=Hydractinia symbiolongicarpus TaxID=13093 RepID=UPI0025507C14|nr:lysosomal acid phosphatase-like [Hydractinia symbiolongicarpus]XP_057302556.1 lysosomal acid phosphatase-like [Hydractinia symbiolongicarpus]
MNFWLFLSVLLITFVAARVEKDFHRFNKRQHGKTLKMVHLLYRHGHRSPVAIYPNNPYQEKVWPDGLERLTQIGMNMEYDLGKFLRKRYVQTHFINSSYLHKEVYIRSSATDRCLQSAEAQLAALYPPKGWQVWNADIPWQPVPIQTVPADNDPVLRPDSTYCPTLHKIWEAKKHEPKYVRKEKKYAKLMKYVSRHSGWDVNFDNAWIVMDDLKSEKVQGLPTPKWALPIYDDLQYITDWLFLNKYIGGAKLGKILGGTLLGVINEGMLKLSKGKDLDKLRKLNMFSGHDTSILSLSTALDIPITESPYYASCLMIELYTNHRGAYFVEMNFRNDSSGSTYPAKLRHCGHSCPLKRFIKLTQRRVPTDRDADCGITKEKPISASHTPQKERKQYWRISTFVFLVSTVLMVVVLFVYSITRTHSYGRQVDECAPTEKKNVYDEALVIHTSLA